MANNNTYSITVGEEGRAMLHCLMVQREITKMVHDEKIHPVEMLLGVAAACRNIGDTLDDDVPDEKVEEIEQAFYRMAQIINRAADEIIAFTGTR